MTPLFQEFNPRDVKFQITVINDILKFDYSIGVYEILLSGSVGSAKSILVAHLIWRHVIENKGARVLVVRRALKDLKRTLWRLIIQHAADISHVIKSYNKSEMKITLINGSEIIGDSYDSGDLEKFRSLDLSMGVIEEASESYKDLYDAIKMRVGRVLGVTNNLMIALTNPDSPSHYLYEYFIAQARPNRKVFYSLTEDNPYIPRWYIENLKRDLDPKMALRMLQGQWVEIDRERIYYAYDQATNYVDAPYVFDPKHEICLCHDFNRSAGKPMSAAVGQKIDGVFHVAKTFLVEGARTQDIMDEIADSGVLNISSRVAIYGDATGEHQDTRTNLSDWEIIRRFLANYQPKLSLRFCVPKSNPPIRSRHNLTNALFKNDLGEVRVKIYKEAKDASKGFLLTAPKKGGVYAEDDSLREQHVTTALTYWFYYSEKTLQAKPLETSRMM